MKFKLGDRVKNKEHGKGTVIGFDFNDGILVEYDKFMCGHNGLFGLVVGRYGKDGHCWYELASDLIKINDKKHFKSLPSDYTGTLEVENGFIQEKEILDEVEKEYLSSVIRPFRKKIMTISKKVMGTYEYIEILFENDRANFPNFKKGMMYKGMEIGKKYSLEELGLNV